MSEKELATDPTKEEAFEKAMKDLDALEDLGKSIPAVETDELDDLTKALEAELGEDLTKSAKEPDGDEDKDDKEKEPDKDDKGAEPEPFDKSVDCKKSLDTDEYDEELVKASDAFADLTKSVQDIGNGFSGELDCLKKSLAALMNLTIKQARVIGSLVKSQQEDSERMAKSLATFASVDGARPIAPGLARIGIGSGDELNDLAKSVTEVTELLTKAVQEHKVDARHLSIFGTYKDVNRLPDDVKKIIGL